MAKAKGKKSSFEAEIYKSDLKQKKEILPPTDDLTPSLLSGSDEVYTVSTVKTEYQEIRERNPLLRWYDNITDWAKKNMLGAVMSLLITAFLGFTLFRIYTIDKDVAILSTKIENLEKLVDEVKLDTIRKDLFDIEIDNLRKSLEDGQASKMKDIEYKVDILEIKINNEIEKLNNKE